MAYRYAVGFGGERVGGVGGVAAGRVVGVVEVEDDGAGFVEAVGGEGGIEETAGTVGGGAASRHTVADTPAKSGFRQLRRVSMKSDDFPQTPHIRLQ